MERVYVTDGLARSRPRDRMSEGTFTIIIADMRHEPAAHISDRNTRRLLLIGCLLDVYTHNKSDLHSNVVFFFYI